jgi:VIT1/CCC1 family predicted Fe2+/Mn2+ transporter
MAGARPASPAERDMNQGEANEVRRWRELLASERDAAALYSRLADVESGERRKIFEELRAIEQRHAEHWEDKLRNAGAEIPSTARPSLRTRLVALAARQISTAAVLPLIERGERADAGMYDAEPDAAPGMAAEERSHARTLSRLKDDPRPTAPREIADREGWHRTDRSGSLRAAVFGVSDGLVSNAALVMGFAGSGSSRTAILLAGIAGLLAGAFSMAAGEYVSMSSQREMYQREISLEAQEVAEKPEEEHAELVLLYRAKGLDRADAERLADRIMADPEVALDTLAREELGLDPEALGSPWSAAISSLLAFASGAVVVVVPYLFTGGTAALFVAIGVVALALFGVGAGIGVLNGRSFLRSGVRQVIAGGLAAAVVFGVGHLIGTTVS